MEELKIKIPKSETENIDKPFIVCGYGVNSFFDVTKSLMYMCLFITVFLLPVYIIYSCNEASGLQELDRAKYVVNQFSLGNLGLPTDD